MSHPSAAAHVEPRTPGPCEPATPADTAPCNRPPDCVRRLLLRDPTITPDDKNEAGSFLSTRVRWWIAMTVADILGWADLDEATQVAVTELLRRTYRADGAVILPFLCRQARLTAGRWARRERRRRGFFRALGDAAAGAIPGGDAPGVLGEVLRREPAARIALARDSVILTPLDVALLDLHLSGWPREEACRVLGGMTLGAYAHAWRAKNGRLLAALRATGAGAG